MKHWIILFLVLALVGCGDSKTTASHNTGRQLNIADKNVEVSETNRFSSPDAKVYFLKYQKAVLMIHFGDKSNEINIDFITIHLFSMDEPIDKIEDWISYHFTDMHQSHAARPIKKVILDKKYYHIKSSNYIEDESYNFGGAHNVYKIKYVIDNVSFPDQFYLHGFTDTATVYMKISSEIAGKEIFTTYKCLNCHKVWEEGKSDKGPNLGTHQIGLYPEEYLREQIIHPAKVISAGFEDEISKDAMPDYYGEDIYEEEMKVLLIFLGSLKSDKRIPVAGRAGEEWTWWDDPKIIEEGKAIYEGITYPGVNCALCHGKDGKPTRAGAFDLRDKEMLDTPRVTTVPDMTKKFTQKPFKDWTDELYADRVFNGIEGSPMPAFAQVIPKIAIWKAMAYAKTFAFPIEKRPLNPNAGKSAGQPKYKQFDVPPPDLH